MDNIKPEDKKISKLKIVYEDMSEEDALIYIPINQVEGLEEQLTIWTIYDGSSEIEESN